MAWSIEISASAEKDLEKLDRKQAQRILRFLNERVAKADDPRSIGQASHGERYGEFWRYRVGDYRLICKIEEERIVLLVLRIGHRREIYR